MGEIAGELMALFADGFLRKLRIARARRRLAAGRPVRLPCSARSERPGWQRAYVNGRLRIVPGAGTVTFGSRVLGHTGLATGGTFHAPEPDAWHDPDWGSTAYLPPDGGHPVHLQVDNRYLPMVHAALTDPRALQKV
ncbi:hypothetical protein OH807_16440 [Kitasatospora sp. NBC_01560]|uniref:hypothetical protein n=1 Tax=Kitasatospora sp. NBC_01560 TaxID=2975965 RepID=UPI0038633F84